MNQPSAKKGFYKRFFSNFAAEFSWAVGTLWAFLMACLVIVVWAMLGPRYRYSDTWQLVINTGTTVVTFLMVFLIQNTQNRDAKAINLKLDEVIRAIREAHNEMIDIERLPEDELDKLEKQYEAIGRRIQQRRARKKSAA